MSNKFEPLKSCDDGIEDEATSKDQKDKDNVNYRWEILLHSPYSPDMSPPNYDLFPELKKPLPWKHFQTIEEAFYAVTRVIRQINRDGVLTGLQDLPKRWATVIEKDGDYIDKAPIPVPAGEHRLQYSYCLWFSRRSPGKQASVQNYDQNLKLIGRFASVEQFWALYSHLARPSDLQSHSDFHLFKIGIKPMWEDEANQRGGKWIVRLRKGLASRCWENLVLAMLGEQFMVGEEICGAVVSIRYQEDIISVWNKTAGDTATTSRIRDTLRRVLNLPPNTILEYKTHNDSLKAWKTVPPLKS